MYVPVPAQPHNLLRLFDNIELPLDQVEAELGDAHVVRRRDLRCRRLPLPAVDGEQLLHVRQIAVKRWAIGRLGIFFLHEQDEQVTPGPEAGVNFTLVLAAISGVDGAQTRLLVDHVERPRGRP